MLERSISTEISPREKAFSSPKDSGFPIVNPAREPLPVQGVMDDFSRATGVPVTSGPNRATDSSTIESILKRPIAITMTIISISAPKNFASSFNLASLILFI
jgi:hypothetical protein